MSLSAEPWQPILDALAQLRAGWPAPEWTWDPRLECATSSFEASLIPGVRAVLDTAVPTEWTDVSIAAAPEDVRALSERCGSLRSNQLVLTGHTAAGMFPFALWWPWGDGSKVSVRLGIWGTDRPKELFSHIRAVFRIP